MLSIDIWFAKASLVLALVAPATLAGQTPPAFNRTAWEADYRALKIELERNHAHLTWFGSPQGGVDLPSLDRATQDALTRSQTDAEAANAIRRFIAGFHDGHLAPAAPPAPQPTIPEPPTVERAGDARTACAAFGYAPVTRVVFSLPFESLAGFTLVSDGFVDAFRAGMITEAGLRIGIVRIPRFRAVEFPSLCESVWQSLHARGDEPTRGQISALVGEEWLRTLAKRVRDLKERGASALVVDIGGNGGGNDLGDWAVRVFTRESVRSAPLLMPASPAAIPYYDEQLQDLRSALASATGLSSAGRTELTDAIAEFEARKREAASPACDMSWVWRERRPWGTSACTRLIPSGFASGARAYADSGTFPPSAAHALYWASRADAFRGAWNGATYVLIDANTGSAAEMFAALIRDRGIAKTIGKRTFGLGCGFLAGGPPFVLPSSRLAFSIPNCVRLRADGTDEVAGIAPDIPMEAAPGESPRGVASRVLQALAGDRARTRDRRD